MTPVKAVYDLIEEDIRSASRHDLSQVLMNLRAKYGLDSASAEHRRLLEMDDDKIREHKVAMVEFQKHYSIGTAVNAISPSNFVTFYHTDEIVVAIADMRINPQSISTYVTGDPKFCSELMGWMSAKFPRENIAIKSLNQGMFGLDITDELIPIRSSEEVAAKEHYPYMPKPAKLLDDFMSSSANVLVLIGPPGTGKSTYLRAMLSDIGHSRSIYTAASAGVHKNPELLRVMKNSTSNSIFVFEDSDILISSRSDGNHQMSEILNITDGITTSNRKFIFSTNLPDLSKVDKALLRPGRCFGAYGFRKLTAAEALTVYEMHNLEMPVNYTDSTLAEIMNPPNNYADTVTLSNTTLN